MNNWSFEYRAHEVCMQEGSCCCRKAPYTACFKKKTWVFGRVEGCRSVKMPRLGSSLHYFWVKVFSCMCLSTVSRRCACTRCNFNQFQVAKSKQSWLWNGLSWNSEGQRRSPSAETEYSTPFDPRVAATNRQLKQNKTQKKPPNK